MVTYTEVYSNGQGIKDISASRFYYLSVYKGLKKVIKKCRNKYSFMRYYGKSNLDYIVYNPENL